MVDGLNFKLNADDFPCEVCLKAKICQLSYRLVHSDIARPFKVESLGGAKYFDQYLIFINDKIRFITVAMLKNRANVFMELRKFMH